MSEMKPRQNSNLKGAAWVVYSLTFIVLVFVLLFAFIFSRGNPIYPADIQSSADLQTGNWDIMALVLTITCFLSGWFIASHRLRWIIALVYSVGIISMLIVIPAGILHINQGDLFSLYTPIPWFLVGLSIAMMCIFVAMQNRTPSSTGKPKQINPSRKALK